MVEPLLRHKSKSSNDPPPPPPPPFNICFDPHPLTSAHPLVLARLGLAQVDDDAENITGLEGTVWFQGKGQREGRQEGERGRGR